MNVIKLYKEDKMLKKQSNYRAEPVQKRSGCPLREIYIYYSASDSLAIPPGSAGIGLDKSVASVRSAVYDVYNACLRISEHIKLMSEHVHL